MLSRLELHHTNVHRFSTSAVCQRTVKSFTLYVQGREVYGKEKADALEADLQPLVGGTLISRLSKHDTNPASNPQPPAHYRR
jgi:hypothetical protein